MSKKLRCPKCGADIGSVFAAHAGRATSKAKAEAARRNAKKGGWPKGKPRKMRYRKKPIWLKK
jgi:hypothetical protein